MTGFKSTTIPLDEYPGGRIMKIIKHYGLNRNSFSLRIGMTNNSLVTRITNNPDMGMALDLIQKILRTFPDVSAEWFILGRGGMLKSKSFPDPKLHYIKYMKGEEQPHDLMRITGFDDCDYAFDLIGAGMSPRYNPGDVLICKEVDKESKDIIYGEAYLMVISEQKRILRYIKGLKDDNTYKLGAEDPRYEDSIITRDEIKDLFLIKGLVRKEVL